MNATKALNVPISFVLKQEPDDNMDNDASSVSSLLLPAMPDSNLIAGDDPDDEFLRLTTMVRGVYFSYLHKSLISNYVICCQSKEEDIPEPDLKKCAGQMELNAVRASLEASLYRQAMLKMISDVKVHTSHKRLYEKVMTFLHASPIKIDKAVQTDDLASSESLRTPDTTFLQGKDTHVQNSSVSSNYDESKASVPVQPALSPAHTLDERISLLLEPAPTRRASTKVSEPQQIRPKTEDPLPSEEDSSCFQAKNVSKTDNDIHEIFGDDNVNAMPGLMDREDSQDSLLQHMEDMFCDSDDSSDLMALIEKHSGVSKANIDLEIGKMCPETNAPQVVTRPGNRKKDNTGQASEVHTNKRKLSFSSYKKMKKQAKGEPKEEETEQERRNRKASGVWLVERIHQVSKLKEKMTEISITNYRKHGRIKLKFVKLFGETDDEEMMPDSPICIEEHLNACKERIAPWVVKYLMPFYKKKRIGDRRLFKSVAKHVADMLIIENTFPEEADVNKYIQNYFKNKKIIKTKPDIYI